MLSKEVIQTRWWLSMVGPCPSVTTVQAGAKCKYSRLFGHAPSPVDAKTFTIKFKKEDGHITLLRHQTNFEDTYSFQDNYLDWTSCPSDLSPRRIFRVIRLLVTKNWTVHSSVCSNPARVGISCLRTLGYTLDAVRGLSFSFTTMLLASFTTIQRRRMFDQEILCISEPLHELFPFLTYNAISCI